MEISSKQTGKFGGQASSAKFQKNFKIKLRQWPNKTNALVKQWQGNIAAKIPCKICDKLHYGECWNKGKPKFHKCSKFGHIAKDCSLNKGVQQVNFVNQIEETGFVLCKSLHC